MFSDETRRRVNLGGKSASATISRSALLEQSRKERHERSQLKLQHSSASTIQSHYRAFTHRRLISDQIRQHFDQQISVALAAINEQNPQSFHILHNLIRSFILFRSDTKSSSSTDSKRWTELKSLIVASLKSRQSSIHYGAALANSSNNDSQSTIGHIHTFIRLLSLLLDDLNDLINVNEASAANSAFLLFTLNLSTRGLNQIYTHQISPDHFHSIH